MFTVELCYTSSLLSYSYSVGLWNFASHTQPNIIFQHVWMKLKYCHFWFHFWILVIFFTCQFSQDTVFNSAAAEPCETFVTWGICVSDKGGIVQINSTAEKPHMHVRTRTHTLRRRITHAATGSRGAATGQRWPPQLCSLHPSWKTSVPLYRLVLLCP